SLPIIPIIPIIIFAIITVGIAFFPVACVCLLIAVIAYFGYLVIRILKSFVIHFFNMATITDLGSKASFRIQVYKKNENDLSMNGSISMQSKFDEIRTKIEQKLEGNYSGIVKINFPAGELGDLKSDGGEKERVHVKLLFSFENQNQTWWASANTICVVRGNQYRPDVGVWFRPPTRQQRRMPIVYPCPPPNVWVEQNTTGIEFVAIGLSSGLNPFPPKPETEMMVHATSQLTRPTRAPYACHWDLNHNEIWYKMDWNQFIILRCGLTISFDVVLKEL
ncbi:3557_t:CDS:2, partial [Diversispora eburnea]